jgi:hypothetical protein
MERRKKAGKRARLRTEDDDGDIHRTEDTELVGFLEETILALQVERYKYWKYESTMPSQGYKYRAQQGLPLGT